MNAVAKVETSEPVSMLAVIARAAADPDTDVDKLERLLAIKERMDAREAETAFNQALTAAQGDMGRVSADATNPQTRSKYATYAKLDSVLRPIYTRHGFALSFDEGESAPETALVLCHVSHTSGHSRTYRKLIAADGKGAKGNDVMTKTHASGAAMSYGMRYLLKGIFNVAVGEEDKDGNSQNEPTINDKQVADLEALLQETGGDPVLFKKWARIDSMDQILAKNFANVCKEVRARAVTRGVK